MPGNSSTPNPGLVHAVVIGFSPSKRSVDLMVTAVGRDQGPDPSAVGAAFRSQTSRVQVLDSGWSAS
ncbi:hypothetical protein [Nocardiopsis sp. LOL_012]|uniref:hypothetical protein n=1 Tax=Nocardiopsis sp. LOL_012 TaxID=3345409 RepID=UPI003A86CACB